MTNFIEKLNFSRTKDNDDAIKLHNRNRDYGYYYDNLCLYCANNNIDPRKIDKAEFNGAVEVMEDHGTSDLSTDHYYFWID